MNVHVLACHVHPVQSLPPTSTQMTPKSEDRRDGPDDRRSIDLGRPGKAPDRRNGNDDRRRRGPLNRRARFSVFYFLAAFLVLIGLNILLSRQETERIPYSELKERIAAGQVDEVRFQGPRITAVPDTAIADAPDVWTSVRVEGDEGLVPLLESQDVEYAAATESWLGQALFWLLPLGLMVLFWIWMLKRINPASGVMTVGKNKARIVGEDGTGVTFDDVAGADEAKQELVEIVEFLREPAKFHRVGARIPKGVLLAGAPGTGKTLLARAVAGEAGVTFFSMNGSEFVEMFVGVGAARVRDLFEQAKSNSPCIVFIDELDALGKARGAGGPMGGHDEREQTLNQLLVEMDGFDAKTGVIIMAATNRPEILDPALMRPGRFDRQVVVDRPDREGREAILRVHAAQIRLGPDVDLNVLARRTPGFVGADLANLLNEGALLAARQDKTQVDMADLDAAIDRVMAGLEKKNRLVNEKERRIVAYHEAGHAIVAERVEHADPVHKISIIPRGVGALGYTQQLPEDDRYLLQRQELLDRMAVLLGGRVAEEIVFDEISTGASNDLERVSELARAMIRHYGMSETLGPVSYEKQRHSFLGGSDTPWPGERTYSEDTAREIDKEVRELVQGSRERAREILTRDREILNRIAEDLLEREVVTREELRVLMGTPPNQPGDDERRDVGHAGGESAAAAARIGREGA
ncbi:MAG TPA: ATP-dependent zinc metalloprotease FtsH [Longimicrobiales bacterium]|nr:ATP-dependent zinc metalloprotease FtsH [Longimicrobiales bacterium]